MSAGLDYNPSCRAKIQGSKRREWMMSEQEPLRKDYMLMEVFVVFAEAERAKDPGSQKETAFHQSCTSLI